MGKIEKLKEAIKNPPPQRLAQIEYRSHLFQSFGIIFVCIMLIMKGFWYIIFALIFGVGISYSQGMSAYMKYKAIMSYVEEEKPEDFENDISPTRRRSKIIHSVFGSKAHWLSIIVSIVSTILLHLKFAIGINRWALSFGYLFLISGLYMVFYLGIAYYIAYLI